MRRLNAVKNYKQAIKIIGVGQEKGEIEDIIGWRLEDIVDKIKGKKRNKKFVLKLNLQKVEKASIVTLVRDKVRIEDQAAKLTVSKVEGETVGVIKIPSFYIGLTDDVKNY